MAKQVSISEARVVRELARQLIVEHHPHLGDATILYLFTTQRGKKWDRVRLGSAAKLPALARYLSSGEAQSVEDGADFVILIGLDEWGGLETDQRVALVDHELSHCGVGVNRHGERAYKLVGHDVEEFGAVIRRHGLWKHDLQRMADAIDQLRMPLGLTKDETA